MSDTPSTTIPSAFAAAVESVRRASTRDDLSVSEMPAPGGLAPRALALAGDVVGASGRADAELGTGRFVLLHDESEPEAWGGAFRVVCFAQAPLETDLALDPFVADVAWSWLVDSLAARGAAHHAASGPAPKVLSTGYGELASQGDGAQLELRASWTPTTTDLAPHLEAWSELICTLAGLPPTVEGVTLLASRRVGRD